MDQPFSETFQIRWHDLDGWNQLRSSTLMSYIEQTANNLSIGTGFGVEWYAQQGTAFVMRSFHLQWLGSAAYQDTLTVTTWVSSSQRVRLCLDFEIRHADGRPVAVARSEWVHVNRHSRRPQPFAPVLLTTWPSGPASSLWQELPPSNSMNQAYEPITQVQPVFGYDAESLGVTSFTVYALWLEEAAHMALRQWGYPLSFPNPEGSGSLLVLRKLEIQYLGPTRPGESLTITTRHAGSNAETSMISVEQAIHSVDAAECLRAKLYCQVR